MPASPPAKRIDVEGLREFGLHPTARAPKLSDTLAEHGELAAWHGADDARKRAVGKQRGALYCLPMPWKPGTAREWATFAWVFAREGVLSLLEERRAQALGAAALVTALLALAMVAASR